MPVNTEKSVDKGGMVCYNNKAVGDKAEKTREKRKNENFFQKTLDKNEKL